MSFDRLLVIYGYREVYERDGRDIDNLIKEVSKYNRKSLMEVMAKVTLKLSCGDLDDLSIQGELIQGFFGNDKEFQNGLYQKIKDRSSPWVVFVEQSVLFLLNLGLIYAKKNGGIIIDEPKVHDIGILLLESTDICVPNYAGDNESIREFLTRQFFLMSNERLMYRIARYKLLFDLMVNNKSRFDIVDFFSKATNGKSFLDYNGFCFYLMVKWINLKKDKVDLIKDWVVSKKKYFSLTKIPENEIDTFSSLLVVPKKEYKKLAEKYKTISADEGVDGYDFMVFRKYPFVEFDSDRFVCSSPNFLMDKATEGVYWIIEEYLQDPSLKVERDLLPNLWGESFETYINDRFEEGFGDKYVKNVVDSSNKKKVVQVCDGLIIGEKCLMLVETKYAHWSYKAKVSGKRKHMNSVLFQLFSEKKALGQLKNAFQKMQFTLFGCQFGRVDRKILQIIVVGEQIPMDKLNWLLYEEVAKNYGTLIKHKNLLPFIILTAEDVEGITALAKENKILAENYLMKYSKQFKPRYFKGKDDRDVDSFKGFLFKKNIVLPVNKELSNVFGDVANNASRKAFNKKI